MTQIDRKAIAKKAHATRRYNIEGMTNDPVAHLNKILVVPAISFDELVKRAERCRKRLGLEMFTQISDEMQQTINIIWYLLRVNYDKQHLINVGNSVKTQDIYYETIIRKACNNWPEFMFMWMASLSDGLSPKNVLWHYMFPKGETDDNR